MHKEIIAICSVKLTRHRYTLCGQNIGVLKIKPTGWSKGKRADTVIWKRKPLSAFWGNLALEAATNPSQVRSEWNTYGVYTEEPEDLKDLLFMYRQPLADQDILIVEESRSQLDTTQSVGFLWTSDQPYTETWKHTALTRDRHAYLPRDSNPQS
jgi:hypothetical protein